MNVGKDHLNADPGSRPQETLGYDLQRSFELARMAVEKQNESIARVTRSLDELVEVLDKAMPILRGHAQTDRAG
ncbi:MAG: hypothetical protein OXP09_07705 [Gammaproteobacteria bacterium]|nr:hypothetical protein [Gammaproteobacteria bacterium]MDE0365444.1 hypothetical protein [Gammaproteobacteria bacterium]